MSETEQGYSVTELAVIDAILSVLTPNQLLMVYEQLHLVRELGFGEVTIQLKNNRMFIVRTESYDCGKVVK